LQTIRSHVDIAVQDPDNENFKLFENESLLEITLKFDLATYFRTKPKDEYLKANITFHLSKTDSITRDIRLKTRGIFRNEHCVFSPIELNFKKVDFGYSDLNRISKIKLVPECNSGNQNENYILREYLIYKLYNVISDTSFRVRLLKINYIDSEKKKKNVTQFGFFIEPLNMLTARTNTTKVEWGTLTKKSIFPEIMDRVTIFNYMIGNYDWSVPGQHNIKVVKSPDIEAVPLGIAIPYDFDWTGLVNAVYAIPAESVGIKTVRERVFLGLCRPEEVYRKELEFFIEKKEEFYNVIKEFPYLNQRAKKDMTRYLDEFFDKLTGKNSIVYVFMNSCKNY
jgi:hypothetical protein